MKSVSGILALLLLTSALGTAAFAEELAAPVQAASAKEEGTPVTRLDAATDALMKNMDDNQLRQFGAIQNAYGIIRAVEDVQQSVSRAVESCGKANPDIKDTMATRFESWKEAVRPVMSNARTRLDKMILLQGFAQPSEVRSYLKKFEAAVIYRNQGIKPVPITKKEDCTALQSGMDKTQSELIEKLKEALSLDKDIVVKGE